MAVVHVGVGPQREENVARQRARIFFFRCPAVLRTGFGSCGRRNICGTEDLRFLNFPFMNWVELSKGVWAFFTETSGDLQRRSGKEVTQSQM
jgi:hypothetical protein